MSVVPVLLVVITLGNFFRFDFFSSDFRRKAHPRKHRIASTTNGNDTITQSIISIPPASASKLASDRLAPTDREVIPLTTTSSSETGSPKPNEPPVLAQSPTTRSEGRELVGDLFDGALRNVVLGEYEDDSTKSVAWHAWVGADSRSEEPMNRVNSQYSVGNSWHNSKSNEVSPLLNSTRKSAEGHSSSASSSLDSKLCRWVPNQLQGDAERWKEEIRNFCVSPTFDTVSSGLSSKGGWQDCDVLPVLWNSAMSKEERGPRPFSRLLGKGKIHRENSAMEKEEEKRDRPQIDRLYLEIGANIGACVMKFLLSLSEEQLSRTGVIAFEPQATNLFRLTSSLSRFPAKLRKHVVVFPLGLGSVASTQLMYSAVGNMGNSVVGQKIADHPGQKMEVSGKILIRPMKDILGRIDQTIKPARSDGVRIPLVKVDCQGFECQAFGGMAGGEASRSLGLPSLFSGFLKMEVAKKWLDGQHCSTETLEKYTTQWGFESKDGDRNIWHKPHGVYDVVLAKKGF